MKNQDLIKSVIEENHVKFRSILNESLYSLLSDKISNKTFEMMSELFDAEIIEEQKNKKPDEDGDGVPDWADKKPGENDNEDEDEDDDDDEDEDEDEDEDDKNKNKKDKKKKSDKKQTKKEKFLKMIKAKKGKKDWWN